MNCNETFQFFAELTRVEAGRDDDKTVSFVSGGTRAVRLGVTYK
jgi:hypothetical protein